MPSCQTKSIYTNILKHDHSVYINFKPKYIIWNIVAFGLILFRLVI